MHELPKKSQPFSDIIVVPPTPEVVTPVVPFIPEAPKVQLPPLPKIPEIAKITSVPKHAHPFLSQKTYKVNKMDPKMLLEMKEKSKMVSELMQKRIGNTIRQLYEQKLKEAKQQFAD